MLYIARLQYHHDNGSAVMCQGKTYFGHIRNEEGEEEENTDTVEVYDKCNDCWKMSGLTLPWAMDEDTVM